jgi:hypothetical protein
MQVLAAAGIAARQLPPAAFAAASIEKLLWASTAWLLSAAYGGIPVGQLAAQITVPGAHSVQATSTQAGAAANGHGNWVTEAQGGKTHSNRSGAHLRQLLPDEPHGEPGVGAADSKDVGIYTAAAAAPFKLPASSPPGAVIVGAVSSDLGRGEGGAPTVGGRLWPCPRSAFLDLASELLDLACRDPGLSVSCSDSSARTDSEVVHVGFATVVMSYQVAGIVLFDDVSPGTVESCHHRCPLRLQVQLREVPLRESNYLQRGTP